MTLTEFNSFMPESIIDIYGNSYNMPTRQRQGAQQQMLKLDMSLEEWSLKANDKLPPTQEVFMEMFVVGTKVLILSQAPKEYLTLFIAVTGSIHLDSDTSKSPEERWAYYKQLPLGYQHAMVATIEMSSMVLEKLNALEALAQLADLSKTHLAQPPLENKRFDSSKGFAE